MRIATTARPAASSATGSYSTNPSRSVRITKGQPLHILSARGQRPVAEAGEDHNNVLETITLDDVNSVPAAEPARSHIEAWPTMRSSTDRRGW
jgi:hypothetical protein